MQAPRRPEHFLQDYVCKCYVAIQEVVIVSTLLKHLHIVGKWRIGEV